VNRVVTRMHRGQSGFTLIELLVVIAILGVIAAIVALNVAGFFGRGTLQAAKTEAHQAQTAIISAMADGQINRLVDPSNNQTLAVAPKQPLFTSAALFHRLIRLYGKTITRESIVNKT